MNNSIYDEIRQNINSGVIASLPKERLEQFLAALARAQAYTHFGASEFPRVCETVKTLLIARSNEKSLAPPSPNASIETKSGWIRRNGGVLVLGTLASLLAAALWYLYGPK